MPSEVNNALLHQWYEQEGLSLAAIARRLRVRRSRMPALLAAAGISVRAPGRRPTASLPFDDATLMSWYAQDRQTIREIAQRTEISYHQVRARLVALGVVRRRGPRRDRPPLSPEAQAVLRSWKVTFGVGETVRLVRRLDPTVRSPQILAALLGERLKTRGQPRRIDDAAVRAAYEVGVTVTTLAARWQCHPRTIERSLQRTCVRPELGGNGCQ